MSVGVAVIATAFNPKMVCAFANSLFHILHHHTSPLNPHRPWQRWVMKF
jgi:hypothetical protein